MSAGGPPQMGLTQPDGEALQWLGPPAPGNAHLAAAGAPPETTVFIPAAKAWTSATAAIGSNLASLSNR